MKTVNEFALVATLLTCLFSVSCEETPDPLGPCEDNEWATATRNGEEHCMGGVQITYWNANTEDAKIIMTAGNEAIPPYEINAEFRVPVEGIELNRAYPAIEGNLFGADPIFEGSLTLLVFDPPAQGKAGCFAGVFSLKAGSPSATTFDYSNGKVVYYIGTVYESDHGTAENSGCNPFN